MKIKCLTEDIRKGIHVVENIISSSAVKPILQSIKIIAEKNTIELFTTDLEVSVSYKVENVDVIESGVIVCPENKIASIAKEWNEDSIEIFEENKVCFIKGRGSYFKILCVDPEEFPSMPKFVDEGYLEIDGDIFAEMIRKTAFITLAERVKYNSNGILLDVKGDQIKMVTNDGRRLSEIKKKVDNKEDLEKSCVIPNKGISQILRILSGQRDVVKIRVEEKRILVKTKSSILCSQLLEGQYPNYVEVIPANLDKKVILDKDVLISSVRRGAIMTTEDYKLLRFKFLKNMLELKCESPDVGESKVEVPIDYAGEEIEMGFNPDYIVDFLKTVDMDKVEFEMKDSETAGVFKAGSDHIYVIMPMDLMESEDI